MGRHTRDSKAQRLTPVQLKALRHIANKEVEMNPHDTVPVKGSPVHRVTFWSLEERGLARVYGWYESGKADVRLTPFGKQVLAWSETV